jgi:hypothetical protein
MTFPMNKSCVLLILIVLAAFGCASDKEKPSADSLAATGAYDHIDALKKAYEAKKEFAIEERLVPELAEVITKELSFEKAELFFEKRLIRITESFIIVHLNWRGSWWIETNNKIENRGVADFVFNKETMILSRIDGDNPFIIPLVEK